MLIRAQAPVRKPAPLGFITVDVEIPDGVELSSRKAKSIVQKAAQEALNENPDVIEWHEPLPEDRPAIEFGYHFVGQVSELEAEEHDR